MALVIDPTFAPALSERANRYLSLARVSYADGKPSRKFFELAIADFTAALKARGRDRHELYSDRAFALASLGRYPSFKVPSRLATVERKRGTREWHACLWIAPNTLSRMLALFASGRTPLYIFLEEHKLDRRRWIRGFALQTIDPAED